ncbi:4-alpha-glucanotransferase [Roseicyclus persicicus]|uniref:4-alpha-glucanotransferase n=1 Tax=Roseicyclus persicicus TaxID=2650661 RepID=A0A7X6GY44_9RHOB|nr:4-alpha-glucanotransferase [Roseibacterium persicicum]NKX43774.1 4-alpha-glucanotransferase [Roseibacterium persicicum]
MSDPIGALAAALGILPRYTDQMGGVRETSRDTALALIAALGVDAGTETQAADRLAALQAGEAARTLPRHIVTTPGRPTRLPADPGDWALLREDGSETEGRGPDLPALPLGLHVLRAGGQETTLLTAPPALPLPPRGWGMTAPLWGLAGPDRPGFGDYDDLRRTGVALAASGAGFLGINPIHAGFPTEAGWASPYSPSHRRRLNPLHIATGPGVAAGPLVDYAAEIPAKRAALRALYAGATDSPGFDLWVAMEGPDLTRFAAHQALSERHGPFWTDWPARLQDPTTAVAGVPPDEIRYHAWLQWMAHSQLTLAQMGLTAAGMRHGLYLDLAVGTHPAGAETWTDRESFAAGVSLGAPPDALGPEGQTWTLAPLNPLTLAAGHYRTLAQTIRQPLRYARLLRIDHILGFDRAFWVPPGLPGAYVRMPRDAMLAVVRIEAARAGATIVGEDLGNIPDGLQGALAEAGILGCRLMQFERDGAGRATPPEGYPALTLASFGTHDLPTMAGWADGGDIRARHGIGRIGAEVAARELAQRAREGQALAEAAGGADAGALHGVLARTGSTLVAVQAEDVLGVAEQTNLPGTIDDYPNWRRKLPVAGPALARDPRLHAVAAQMRDAGR